MKNFPTAFWKRCQEFKDQPAIFELDDQGNRQMTTYWEWTRRVQKLAMGLMEAGFEPKTRLGLVAPNGRDWLDLAVATWLVGGCLVPLVPGGERSDTLRCLGRSGCGWIAVDDDRTRSALIGSGEILPGHLQWVLFEGDAAGENNHSLAALEEQGRDLIRRGRTKDLAERIYALEPSAPTVIFFDTDPGDDREGAFFKGSTVARQLEAIAAQSGWPDGEFSLASLLSFGWFSSFQFTMAALYTGRSIALSPNLRSMSDHLDTLQPHYLVCGPAYLEQLAAQWKERLAQAPDLVKQMAGAGGDSSSVVASALGGLGERAAQKVLYDPIRRDFGGQLQALQVLDGRGSDDVNDILQKIDIALLGHFGLAEAGITHIEHMEARRPGSAGRPIEGIATKIDGAKSEKTGELVVRGDTLFEDYWAGSGRRRIDEHGWLHTGRKAHLESGFLFLE